MPPLEPDDQRSRFEAEALPWMRSLYGFAVRLTRDPDDASDLVQESYLRAYRTFGNFVSGTNAKAWLFRILLSVFSNDQRRRRRQRVVALEELEPHFDRVALASWQNGRNAAQSVENVAALEEALGCLPEEFRTVVLLVDVEGLTYSEAAEALECPVGTVRSRLSRARRGLFAALGANAPRYPWVRGTEVGHAHWSERIDDLVSGELPEDQRQELDRHLSSCEACRAELDALQALRRATRQLGDATTPPAGLEADVRAALDSAPRVPPRRAGSRGAWLAVAAAVVIAAAAVVWFRAPTAEDLPDTAIRSYQLHRVGQLPLAVETEDEEILERFFRRQLDFPARVIDLRMMEYGLIGGRVHELQGRPSALYVYRGPDGRLVLCQMLPGTLEELPPADETHEERGFTFRVYRREGRTAVFWLEGQVLCVLVSDMPAPELLALAREKAMA